MRVLREVFPEDRITRGLCARRNRMLTHSSLACFSITLHSTAHSCSASQRSHSWAQSMLSFKTKFVVLIHSILLIFNNLILIADLQICIYEELNTHLFACKLHYSHFFNSVNRNHEHSKQNQNLFAQGVLLPMGVKSLQQWIENMWIFKVQRECSLMTCFFNPMLLWVFFGFFSLHISNWK